MATGILLSWRRPANMGVVTERMLAQPFIDEVIIWNNQSLNAPTLEPLCAKRRDRKVVKIIHSRHNELIYGRYLAAKEAKNRLIATCDDDVWVSDRHWKLVYDAHIKTGQISANMDMGRQKYVERECRFRLRSGQIAHETLVGWGAVFSKRQTKVLHKYVDRYGVDDLLLREADRIFTILQCCEHKLFFGPIDHLPEATGKDAMYRQKDHWEKVKEARRRAVELLEG